MADTASWLLPSSALSVFQPSRRGSLGQGQHYLFGQSRCKRCLVQKQKPQHLGFHLYLSEMIHIDEHMGGSRHWILDCLQRTICTWTSSTSMSLCRWFALGNVRSWILQVDYISPVDPFLGFSPHWMPWGFWVSVFPKKHSGHQGQEAFPPKSCQMIWQDVIRGIFAALMCAGQLSVREEDGGPDGCSLVFHKHLKYIHWKS